MAWVFGHDDLYLPKCLAVKPETYTNAFVIEHASIMIWFMACKESVEHELEVIHQSVICMTLI